jgi:hypothetical protein
MVAAPNPVTTSDHLPHNFFGALKPPMSTYCPALVKDLTDRLNAMTGLSLTQNDVFRELEAMRVRYAPLTPEEALTRLHTMRPADSAFTRTYLGDAA